MKWGFDIPNSSPFWGATSLVLCCCSNREGDSQVVLGRLYGAAQPSSAKSHTVLGTLQPGAQLAVASNHLILILYLYIMQCALSPILQNAYFSTAFYSGLLFTLHVVGRANDSRMSQSALSKQCGQALFVGDSANDETSMRWSKKHFLIAV